MHTVFCTVFCKAIWVHLLVYLFTHLRRTDAYNRRLQQGPTTEAYNRGLQQGPTTGAYNRGLQRQNGKQISVSPCTSLLSISSFVFNYLCSHSVQEKNVFREVFFWCCCYYCYCGTQIYNSFHSFREFTGRKLDEIRAFRILVNNCES